jgi:tetratricopeptide (TPR) repeat protein
MEAAMDATLNLFDRALALGRRYQELGRVGDAAKVLMRLAGFRDLPPATAEETRARLGEMELKRRRYARARRHLAAALTHRPDSARYHFLLATAFREDDRVNPERAVEHYRRSLEIDPTQVKCLCDFGTLLVRVGQTEEGLVHLRRAVELAPDDAEAAGRLVKALRLAGQHDAAREAARSGLFRNPHSSRFLRIWQDHQFRMLRRQQLATRRSGKLRATAADEPALLPFIRRDDPSPMPAPHFPRLARRRVQ